MMSYASLLLAFFSITTARHHAHVSALAQSWGKKFIVEFFYTLGICFFLLKGTKTELLSFFKNISFFFYYLEDKKNVFLAVVRLLSLCFSAAGQVMDECRHLSTSNEETP